jgi:uncharacterized protein (DUF488 family)
MTIYTIGHSNHSQEEFLRLIQTYGITCVVDVRSLPASKHSPQYNQDALEGLLKYHHIYYQFFGKEFGARRTDSYNQQGLVDFELAVKTNLFLQGVQRIHTLLDRHRLALMCSEANPLECHRFALLARYFHEQGFEIQHIMRDASLATHKQLENEMITQYLHAKKPLLADVDELFGTYTAEDQLHDAYRLKNKEIGYRQQQEEDYYI